MSGYALFPTPQHFCSLADYGAILAVTKRLRPRTVLEFGPGWSTLALVEGGAGTIDCMEDDYHWVTVNAERLAAHGNIELMMYQWADPLSIAAADGLRYDLGVVDGPRETHRRPAVIRYCLERCTRVLVPLECNEGSTLLTDFCRSLRLRMEVTETGPLAGSWALLTA